MHEINARNRQITTKGTHGKKVRSNKELFGPPGHFEAPMKKVKILPEIIPMVRNGLLQ